MKRTASKRTVLKIFWKRADVIHDEDSCWEWLLSKNKKGYGWFQRIIDGIDFNLAHRVAWYLEYGEIPEGKMVLHKCDNPACVRPSHLFLGTNKENMEDKVRKGRSLRGERNHQAKLSDAERFVICKLYHHEDLSEATLGLWFNVGQSAIHNVLQNWY